MNKKHFNSVDEMTYTKLDNHKPDDFDEFWEKQIEEIKNLNPKVTIEKTFNTEFARAEYYDLYFESFDKSKIHCKYLKPKVDGNTPIVVIFHGYPGATRSYFEYSAFLDKGIAVLGMDCRGQGGRSYEMEKPRLNMGPTVSGHIVDGLHGKKEDLFYINIYKDAYLAVNVARNLDDIDKDNIFIAGSSQGGGISIVTAALQKNIKKMYLLYPFLTDYRKVFELDYDEIAYEGLRYYSRWYDPQGKKIEETFRKLAYIDAANFASKIDAEIIYGISLADEVIPPEVQFAVYNEIKSQKKLYQFKGFGHERICPMEDKAVGFFIGDESIDYNIEKNIKTDEFNFSYKYIDNGSKDLMVYLNQTMTVGSHYLRRFSVLNLDSLSYDFNHDESDLANIEYLLEQYKDRYERIFLLAQRENCVFAIDLAKKINCKALILQGMLFDDRTIEKAKDLKAEVLMASCGLDYEEDKELTKKVADSIGSCKVIYYPKYEYERINDFEDEKMVFLNKVIKGEENE